jgi:hypothetical protein
MSTTIITPPESELVKAIRLGYQVLTNAINDVVKRSIEFGEFLNEQQAKFKRGDWRKWLEKECGVPSRTAQRCQQLAKPENKAKIAAAMRKEALSLNKAVALIGNGSSSRSTRGPLDYDGYQSKLIEKLKDMGLGKAKEAVDKTKRELDAAIEGKQRNIDELM